MHGVIGTAQKKMEGSTLMWCRRKGTKNKLIAWSAVVSNLRKANTDSFIVWGQRDHGSGNQSSKLYRLYDIEFPIFLLIQPYGRRMSVR